jgi:hypothetical protein
MVKNRSGGKLYILINRRSLVTVYVDLSKNRKLDTVVQSSHKVRKTGLG